MNPPAAPDRVSTNGTDAPPDLGWVVDKFVAETPGVMNAIVVSVDGLLVAMDGECPREIADQLAAVAAGLNQMCAGAGEAFGAGELQQQLVQYAAGFIVLRALGDGAVVVAVAERGCDMSQVAHELALLGRRVGSVLSPQLITTLRARLRR